MEKLALELSALNLTTTQDPQSLMNQLKQLLSQAGHHEDRPQQPSLPVPENQNYSEILSSLAHLFKTPGGTANPAPHAQEVPQPTQAGAGSGTPQVAGLEKLASEHIAENQPFLEKQEHDKSYTGPTISSIRQDKPTENKVQQVIDALKHISPVFGQPSTPVSQVLPGISPLDQLKQQLSGQTNQIPNSFPPPLQKQPQDILGDLFHLHSNQFPPNQQPTQTLSNFPQVQTPLYVPQPLYPQPPPHPQPQLHHQLSQLLASLQGVAQTANPPPLLPAAPAQQYTAAPAQQIAAPPAQQFSWAQLQQMPATQLLQHPELLRQLAMSATQPPLLQPGLMEVPQHKTSQQPQPAQLLQGMSRPRAVHVRPTDYSRYCQVDYAEKVKADMVDWWWIIMIVGNHDGVQYDFKS